MKNVESWAWYPATRWPGFTSAGQDNVTAVQNGLAVAPSSYTPITWNDANGDGLMDDADTDDATTKGETVSIGGKTLTIKEIGNYTSSTMMVNGHPMTVDLAVWVFTDGTYMVRLADSQIPAGTHYSAVEDLHLGQWNTTEYSGSFTGTRDDPFVCFTAGTLIHARQGLVPVETLMPGDMVLTADHGFQPLRWLGQRQVAGTGSAAPVRIAAGAMGNTRPLQVSQQHRMLLGGWRAELLAGTSEVLVAARHLVNDGAIRIAPCPSVTYVHLLFDTHEIVFAEGIPSESFHPGAVGLSRLEQAARHEVLTLFPALRHHGRGYGPTARPCATAIEGRAIARG